MPLLYKLQLDIVCVKTTVCVFCTLWFTSSFWFGKFVFIYKYRNRWTVCNYRITQCSRVVSRAAEMDSKLRHNMVYKMLHVCVCIIYVGVYVAVMEIPCLSKLFFALELTKLNFLK